MQIFNLLIGVVVVEGACVVFIVVVAVKKIYFNYILNLIYFRCLSLTGILITY